MKNKQGLGSLRANSDASRRSRVPRVTNDKEAEEALRESEEKFRSFIEQSSDGIVLVDELGHVVEWSEGQEKLTGLCRADTLGRPIWDVQFLFLPDEQKTPKVHAETKSATLAVLKTGQSSLHGKKLEAEIQRIDGARRLIETVVFPIKTLRGWMVGSISRDVTERKRVEAELRSTKERLEYVVTSNPAVLYSGKPRPDLSDWDMTYLSENVVGLLGHEAREFVGHPEFWAHLVHPADRPSVLAQMPSLWERGRFTFEYRMLHRDGSYRWIREESNVVRGTDGKPVEVNGYWTDVSVQKQAELALAESEKRFRELADMMPETLFELDEKGNITFLNRTGFETSGYGQDDLKKGLNVLQVIAPESHGLARESIRRVLSGETLPGNEYVFMRKDGSRFPGISHVTAILKDGKVEGLRGVIVNIAERKRLEAQLTESERLAVIGSMAAMVGHDLRNPLQALAGMVYLLTKHYIGIPEEDRKTTGLDAAETLHMMEKSVGYMNKIVSDLQNYAAPLQPELRKASTRELLNESLSAVAIPPYVKVSVTVDKGAETLNADPDLIKRAFTNLVMNAVQAMPRGGELKIAAQKNSEEELISFRDTGVGISKENLSKLFGPFYTTKAQGQGLGLSVCKRVMEAHGGAITVDSAVGKGSTFTARLPIPRNTEKKTLPT